VMRDDRPQAVDQSTAADELRQDDPRRLGELSGRLDSLPDGHPSSRFDANGTPRQPSVDLRDLAERFDEDESDAEADGTASDLGAAGHGPDQSGDKVRSDVETPDAEQSADQKPLITDAEWAEHVTDVRTRLGDAQRAGLSTDQQYTIDSRREVWSDERDLIHDSIIDDLYSRSHSVPCDGKAIVAGGLGGAGKSTVLSRHAGIDLSQYLTINPDDIKEEMARRGLIPEVGGLTPMEASDLVHEECSHIAKRVARRAEADGKNIIWDITMSSRESTERRITDLRADGYSVDGIFVDIPVDTSVRRADARHREGYNDYLAGTGLGGRYVPAELIEAQADPDWGSKNRKTFEEVRHLFDHWSRYDNSVDGRPPTLAQTDSLDTTSREERF
jgi:predicted kinase